MADGVTGSNGVRDLIRRFRELELGQPSQASPTVSSAPTSPEGLLPAIEQHIKRLEVIESENKHGAPPQTPLTDANLAKLERKIDEERSMSETPDGVTMPNLADLLRHPDDLDKIPALKAEFTRKKAAVDAQLRDGLKDQLETVQAGMNALSDGQRHVSNIRDDMQKIDELCTQAENMVKDFPQIGKVAKAQRNFAAVLYMKNGLENFNSDLASVEELLKADDQDMENQPNLLPAHMQLTRLRDFRDEALDQIRRAKDTSSEATLVEYFGGLDSVIEWFDDHIRTASMNLIPLVQADNRGLVVRLAVVTTSEEKNDEKVRAIQEAQKDHQELASRFKSINTGPKTIRGYKEKFLKCVEAYAQAQFDATTQAFLEDPDKLEKSLKWYFNDLFTVKQGLQKLVPKKWKIFMTYTNIYHKMMHDWLIKFVEDSDLRPPNMLAIIHWSEKYYAKMAKLGWEAKDLEPNVLDDREGDLVREWRNLITKALDEWMDRMYTTDRRSFIERKPDTLDNDANGYFRTKTLGDMWRMLREQTLAAGSSDRTDVVEGVVDAMFRALRTRQSQWQTMIDDEAAKYKNPSSDQQEGLQVLQDWLVAIANDQISCIDDNDESGQLSYLARFKRDFEPLVTPKYMSARANAEVDGLRDGYVDLSTHCISTFVSLIFTVDFKTTIPEFFTTQKWYSEYAMKRITSTFDDYIGDYNSVLHPSLIDILVEELSDELLIRYLSSVRNKGARFKRSDPFTDKFKDDVVTAFAFFQKFPDSFATTIKQKWRVVDWLVRLLEADKANTVPVYENFKKEYWDLPLSWVEAVLRARDDFERSMLNGVKARAAEVYVDRGPETIMGKVK